MNTQEILKFCFERGFLLDNEMLTLFNKTEDMDSVKLIIERMINSTNQKIITRNLFSQNKERVFQILSSLPSKNQQQIEKLKINLGLSIEFSKEISASQKTQETDVGGVVKVLSNFSKKNFKLEVANFTKYFRNRLLEMKGILQSNPSLKNLVSINKIAGNKQKISIIGIVSEKIVTKNKNILLEIEDLTGKIKVLISQNNKDLYERAGEITLDSVLGFSGVGDRQIIFASDIVFPDSLLQERKRSPIDESVLFVADLHFGSKLFLENNFLKFIDYLNGKMSNTPESDKIKYLFLVGDIVSGVGNYPNQERDLKIKDIEEQYTGLSEFLGKIRKDITLIISPGNHDGVRLMEPQPLLSERYAWSLYNLKNVILTGNPAYVNIGSTKSFEGFDILTYHGISYHYYGNTIPKLIIDKAVKHAPDKIMHYLLKNRHLAPTHSSTQYFPADEDPLIIKKIPDIMVSGHTHKSATSYYNNILTISTSTWESKTPYQEKMGNEPDFCKVPMFNLKTRAIKILDFEGKEE